MRLLKCRGLPLIKMDLSRRCGHKSEKKIHPSDIGGSAQRIRAPVVLKDEESHVTKPLVNAKYRPNAVGRNGVANAPFSSTAQQSRVALFQIGKEIALYRNNL